MDFELTKSQKDILKAAKEFAKGEFDKELAIELDRKHEFPKKIWKRHLRRLWIRPDSSWAKSPSRYGWP